MIQIKDAAFPRIDAWAMSRSYDAVILSTDLVPQAFPLIRATWPGVDLVAWGSFVRFFNEQQSAGQSGVQALRDATGGLCGVFAYRLDWDLRLGRMLSVQLFTAVDVANSLPTVRALLDAVEVRALQLSCDGIEIRLCGGQAGLAGRLRRLGLDSEAGLLRREVDRTRPPN
jgi:hypothetical protein